MRTQDNNNSCALTVTYTADQSTPVDAAEVAPSKSTVASDPNTDDVKYANGDSTVTYKQKQDTTESKETKTDPEGSDLGTSIHTSDQLQTGFQRETDSSDSPATTSAAHETRGDKDDTCEGADISSPADSYSASSDALESGLENLNSSDGNQNPDTDHSSMGSLNCTSSVSESKPGAENDRKEAPTCEKRHGSAGHTTSNNAKNHQSMTLSVGGNVHSASTGLVTASDQQRTQKVSKAVTQPVLPDKFQIQHARNSGAAQREQTHCTSESKTTGKSGQHLSNQTPIHDSCENSCNQGRGERPLKLEIQIPELIRNMLKGSKRVREEFVYRLSQKGVLTDPIRLSNGYITVVHLDQDSHQQVSRDLVKESFVLIEDIGKDVIDDIEDDIKRLHYETPDLFLCESPQRKGCSTILYHTEILEKVQPLLFKLKYKKLYMHLPGYMWNHLHTIVEDLEKEIKNDPQFQVELEKEMKNDPQFQVRFQIKNNADGAPYVSVTAERAIAAKTEDKMFNLLGKLLFREAQVDPSVDYFRRTEMGQFIKDLERKHQCTINVQTPNQQLLLHAWSPQGHRLMVYEGDMEDADAKVVVLPLCERQKAWPSTHKHILDSGKVCSLKYTEFYIFPSLLDLIYCPRT